VYFKELFGVDMYKTIVLILDNNKITADEIAEKLQLTKRSIENYISKLKEKRYIERVGSDKTGYWKILKQDIDE
jgi:ATP-dependent DNA helicase RecG